MYAIFIFILLLSMSPTDVYSCHISKTAQDLSDCHEKCNGKSDLFNCQCREEGWKEAEPECIPTRWLCDGVYDCTNENDERDCECSPGFFQCGGKRGGIVTSFVNAYYCINETLVNDSVAHCMNSQDKNERRCDKHGAISCDGTIDCIDAFDEKNCDGCKPSRPITCACNKPGDEFSCGRSGRTCISEEEICDGHVHCSDGSDEDGCTCDDDLFACQCYRNNPNSCSIGSIACIDMTYYLDRREHCEDGSDEREYLRRKECGSCNITLRRLIVKEECNNYKDCDSETCIVVPALSCADNAPCSETEVVCMSHCHTSNTSQSCKTIFQCEKGYLETSDAFCNGKIDCPEASDEIRNQFGFKCSSSFGRCVLPQRNLYDNVAQCKDESDLCSKNPCFKCIDGKLIISQTQVCDGVIDCFDLSDECLCRAHLQKPICQELFVHNDPFRLQCGKVNPQCNRLDTFSIETTLCSNQSRNNEGRKATSVSSLPSLISCENKQGLTTAFMCDGRPECRNFEDECSCEDPPDFCLDNCHDFYPLGDRYCDGKIDEAWKFINDTSSCPEGFDEIHCAHRFSCKAGDLVSIDQVQVCNGIIDCDDGSDEYSCSKETIFSSETEMIESVPLRFLFWGMSILVIVGNCLVQFSTARFLSNKNMSDSQSFSHILILNLSFADLLMGFYLLLISIKSVQYSGFYGKVDYQWRTSLECSIIGSLAVISSETSCFIMTIITAFRLYSIFNPFTARTASTRFWNLGILLAWSVSLLLALLPVFKPTSKYFVHRFWFQNQITSSSDSWSKTEATTLACRLASLSNLSIEGKGDAWESSQVFLKDNFPDYLPRGEVGYYGETSVCMPRIYAALGDYSWVYSFAIITFNFTSFLFVGVAYLVVFYKTSHRPIRTSKSDKQSAQMQKRIARLIATDFACWIPICVMVYMKVGGFKIPNVVYLVTAGFLLPINSAINPLLYSPIVANYIKRLFCEKNGLSFARNC